MLTLRQRALTKVVRTAILCRRSTAGVGPPDVPADVTIRWLDRREVQAPDGIYRALRPRTDPAWVERLLGLDCRCLGIFEHGRLVHVGWSAIGVPIPVAYLHRTFPLADDEGMLGDAYSDPAARRSGYSLLRGAALRWAFREAGCSTIYGLVAPENPSADKVIERGDFERLGIYTQLRLGPWSPCWSRAFGPTPLRTLGPW